MAIKGKSLRFDDFRDVDQESTKEGRGFKDFEYAWHNAGKRRDGNGVMKIQDALAMWEAPLFIPKVVNNTVQEAVEPLLIATNLLQRIPFRAGTQVLEFPVMGAVDGDFDVGEEESYPELRVTYGPGTEIGKIGKSGVAVRFTEEVIRYSQFDVVSMAVRQAARAMARNKEEKIFNMWYRVARVTHDNEDPLNSVFGTTTGRGLDGALNGTVTMDDIFEMFAQVMHNGWIPNLLIVHPLTWLMFVQDAQLRAFAIANQNTWFGQQWTGSPSKNDFPHLAGGESISGGRERFHPQVLQGNPAGLANGNVDVDNFSYNLNSAPQLPFYGGFNFRVIVSPFVPYDATKNTTSILMADSNELGFYIEDHGPMTSEWKNPETDILKIKITERFTLREKNRGLALAIAKNVVVDSNKILLPAQATIGVQGSVTPLTRNAAVV